MIVESVRNLRAHCTQVFVGGLSLGATLSLLLAAAGEVDGVIAINTALHASDWRMRLVRFIAPFRPYTPKGLANLHDRDALAQHVDYLRIPLRATASLYQAMRKLERQLPRVNVPLLLIQSRQDIVVRPEGAQIIFERVSSTNKRIVWLERGGHIAVEDYDKDIVFNETQRFITGSA